MLSAAFKAESTEGAGMVSLSRKPDAFQDGSIPFPATIIF